MEDDISDAIYGDLGDFEYNEKLKEVKIENISQENVWTLNSSVDILTFVIFTVSSTWVFRIIAKANSKLKL